MQVMEATSLIGTAFGHSGNKSQDESTLAQNTLCKLCAPHSGINKYDKEKKEEEEGGEPGGGRELHLPCLFRLNAP